MQVMKENGKHPHALSVSGSGSTISWGNHPETDIIGYRVYKNGAKVASIKAGASRSYQGGNGSYYVTAVDIAGKESAPSNVVMVGQAATPPAEETPKETPMILNQYHQNRHQLSQKNRNRRSQTKKHRQRGQLRHSLQNQNKTDKQPVPTVPNQKSIISLSFKHYPTSRMVLLSEK